MALKKADRAIDKEQKKKGLLRRKVLSLPVWLWAIIALLAIIGVTGDESPTKISVDADELLPVTEALGSKLDSESVINIDEIEQSQNPTVEPTGTFGAAPTVAITDKPTPTPTTTPTIAPEPSHVSISLQRGSNGEEVIALQKRLISLGYLADTADGVFGAKTEAALIAYQTNAGLAVTGIFDDETANSIYADDAPSPTAQLTVDPKTIVIKRGDKSEDVRDIQLRLIELGFLYGSADGDFGANTEAALMAYQDAAGLPVTGECNYNTLMSLNSSAAPTAAPTPKPTPKPTSKPSNNGSTGSSSSGSGSSGSGGSGGGSSNDDNDHYSGGGKYIGNKNTKKFHHPWCSSVDQMKDKNKVPLYSREEAISKGYVPCKRCDP